MKTVQEILSFAQRYKEHSLEGYRIYITNCEETATQMGSDEDAVFSFVGVKCSRKEATGIDFPVVIVTNKRILIGGNFQVCLNQDIQLCTSTWIMLTLLVNLICLVVV